MEDKELLTKLVIQLGVIRAELQCAVDELNLLLRELKDEFLRKL